MTVPDRVTYNEPGNWSGPDYALGLVDEVVLSDATVHLEMTDDSSAYMVVWTAGGREVFLRLHATPTTPTERRQILAGADETLRDYVGHLNPLRWRVTASRAVLWSVPVWRRPAAVLRGWSRARRAASVSLRVSVDYDEPEEGS